MFVLSILGLGVAIYLLSDVFFPTISAICPETGYVSCVKVTESAYSRIFGVPVALLATLWFASMGLSAVANRYHSILLPLWAAGLVFVVYLGSVEVFLIHALCTYCTVGHILAILIGIPVIKLSIGGD